MILLRNVNTLSDSSAAKVSWQAIISADPSERYDLFKSGAEEVLDKSWHCLSMKRIASFVGDS